MLKYTTIGSNSATITTTHHKTTALHKLCRSIGQVTSKEQVVPRCDPPCEPREDDRVRSQSRSHGAGDDVFVFLEVGEGGQWQAPVCCSGG